MTVLDFAPEHALSSNELVEVVKKNILLGDWGDEDHNESLLSMRNSKWGQEMLKNVRCVGVFHYGRTYLFWQQHDHAGFELCGMIAGCHAVWLATAT